MHNQMDEFISLYVSGDDLGGWESFLVEVSAKLETWDDIYKIIGFCHAFMSEHTKCEAPELLEAVQSEFLIGV